MNRGGGGGSVGAPTTEPEEDEELLREYPPLSEAEVEYFAARMNLRHIVAPMDGVADIDLRTELEEWAVEIAAEEARCAGMSLAQLVADTDRTFMPEITAALHRAHELLASFDREEQEEEAAAATKEAGAVTPRAIILVAI